MDILLPSELEQFINQQLENGSYLAPTEVVIDALYLLRDREALRQIRLEELRKKIAIGIEQADRGETFVFDEAAAERIKARGRQVLAERQKNVP